MLKCYSYFNIRYTLSSLMNAFLYKSIVGGEEQKIADTKQSKNCNLNRI